MNPISELFSVSPFRCLHDHASDTKTSLQQLQLQFEAAWSKDVEAVSGHLREIQSRVLVGRAISDEAYQLVSRRVMLPVRREDIISTIDTLNLLLCTCGDVASLISARSISLPDDTRLQLSAYVQEVLELSTMATDIVTKVNVLVEVCFEGPEADEVESRIEDVQLRTTKTHLLKNRLLQTLFSNDGDACPLEHSFCLSLLAEMGRIIGFAEQLTSRFHLFIRQRSPSPENGVLATAVKRLASASVSLHSAVPNRATHTSRSA